MVARVLAPVPKPAPPPEAPKTDPVAAALQALTSNAAEMARINEQIAKHMSAKRVFVTEAVKRDADGQVVARWQLRTVEQ